MLAAAGPGPADAPVPTILIVDDDRSVIDTFSRLLKLEGFGVVSAVNAPSGLEMAARLRPSAIILDVRMPILNGLQFLRELRAHAALAAVPVAIVTGDYFLPELVHEEIRSLGASLRYKPLWADELAALAKTLVCR